MAKLLVFAANLPGEEDLKRGHVVSVIEDGDDPGDHVRHGYRLPDGSRRPPNFRVVNVPGRASEWTYMIAAGTKPDGVLAVVPARAHKIDLDALEAVEVSKKGGALERSEELSVTKAAVEARISIEAERVIDVAFPPEAKA